MLTIADGGGGQEPLILADIICEQPLTLAVHFSDGAIEHKNFFQLSLNNDGLFARQSRALELWSAAGSRVRKQVLFYSCYSV